MKSYENHLLTRGIQQFTIDGAIDRSTWDQQKVKILFYLKENYGYQDGGVMQIADYASGWLADKNTTYAKITALAEILHQAIEKGQPLNKEEINEVLQTVDFQTTLRKIAVVNIKKHSGESKSNAPQIREESYANTSLLRQQIKELSPTIIIAGGTVCWHSLVYDLDLSKESHDNPKGTSTRVNGTVLCHSNHPSAWTQGGFDIYELHKSIFSTI